MKLAARVSLCCAALSVACAETAEPRDQWLVSISTDAPLPQFGDRLLVEVLEPGGSLACPGCRRLSGLPEAWPFEFGIAAPAPQRELWLRVRLFRSSSAGEDGLPRGTSLIDQVGVLPSPDRAGAVRLELTLSCFGQAPDLSGGFSCGLEGPAALGALQEGSAQLIPGSWPGAERLPCGMETPPGMVCVPGGAFLLGTPDARALLTDAGPERLVVLSPFALDRDEMTVGRYLDLASELGLPPPTPKSQNPSAAGRFCTYDPDDDSSWDFALNCISLADAKAVCEAQGKRLPTEAEWEFAAGNETAETTYPWGQDPDHCRHAVVARDVLFVSPGNFTSNYECREAGGFDLLPAGVALGGGPSDVTARGLLNLGGNLSEWVSDRHALYTEPCWQPEQPQLLNPECTEGELWVRRGGAWTSLPLASRAYFRGANLSPDASVGVGVRCAQSL